MRSVSAQKRFPVAPWVEEIDRLQTEAIEAHSAGSASSRSRASSLKSTLRNLVQ